MDPITTGLLMAAPKVISGVSKLVNKPPQQKVSSETTAYLNKLRNISKKGLYGEDVKSDVMADIAQSSNRTQNALRGAATRQGLENSGVLAQQLIQEGGQTTLQAAKMAKRIAQANEESKLRAGAEASQISQRIEDIKYQNAMARRQNRLDAFGDFAGALGEGVSAGMDSASALKQMAQADKSLAVDKTITMMQNDPEMLNDFLQYYSGTSGSVTAPKKKVSLPGV